MKQLLRIKAETLIRNKAKYTKTSSTWKHAQASWYYSSWLKMNLEFIVTYNPSYNSPAIINPAV